MSTFDQNHSKVLVHSGSNVLYDPFFRANASNKELDRKTDNNSIDVFGELDQSMVGSSTSSLRELYKGITNRNDGFNAGAWVFWSPNEIKEREKYYKPKMLDIGSMYRGMGHITVVSYIPTTDNFFFRHDGGSSDYDRIEYANTYGSSCYIPANFPVVLEVDPDTASSVKNVQENKQYSYRSMMLTIFPEWKF